MVYNSRMLALILALCVASVTTALLFIFESDKGISLKVAFAIVFGASCLLLWIGLEWLIFREVKKMHSLVNRLKPERPESGEKKPIVHHPLKVINKEIRLFADRKQKEIDELKKLEAFRREFIADVSHELKTPVFAAQGFVHTLLDGAVKDKNVRDKFLRKAAKSLDGLDRLVQDLLTLSQIETGQIKMHVEKVDLYKLTGEVFEQFENRAEKKDIGLRIESQSKEVLAYADAQRMGQVMANLISNAIKHSSDGGEVIVKFKQGKNNITVSVLDFGEGIPAQHIERIFERFYRVDKSRSREKGGTGLGLAIVKHILEGHHTRVRVKSTVGKGSTFSFKLPGANTRVEDNLV